jgi:phosphoribosylformimino-5-aminoimidazole carboxamide ribotide isomerase
VLDLSAGRAVHARAGDRARYLPVTIVAGSHIESGEALAVARAYRDQFGLSELYVADLDAIASHVTQDALVASIAGVALPLWLDAGVTSAEQACHARDLGARKVVVALETLPSYDALGRMCAAVGAAMLAFSLDLRNGVPVVAPGGPTGESPERVARRAADCGVRSIIAIDLARVGAGVGPDLALLARLRAAVPDVVLLAGGGVRGADDLGRLADAGCDGALVATSLHDGRLTAADIAEAQRRQPRAMR